MVEPNVFEVEMAIEKLKRHKSPSIDQIPAELIKAGGRTMLFEIHKLIKSVWNKEELLEKWKSQLLYLFIRRVIEQIEQIVVIIQACHFCQLRTTFYSPCCLR